VIINGIENANALPVRAAEIIIKPGSTVARKRPNIQGQTASYIFQINATIFLFLLEFNISLLISKNLTYQPLPLFFTLLATITFNCPTVCVTRVWAGVDNV
jgi:hypothetical protein